MSASKAQIRRLESRVGIYIEAVAALLIVLLLHSRDLADSFPQQRQSYCPEGIRYIRSAQRHV